MVDSTKLLTDLQLKVIELQDDLRARCDSEPTVDAPLKAQYDAARARSRTALTYKAWREDELTNVAVAWVLACVFIRFLEDNGLLESVHLAGPDSAGLARARDRHEAFFREHPGFSEREYLEHVFTEIGRLPGMADLLDRRHNPLWTVSPSGDASRAFIEFWRKADASTGRPVHDFSDPDWNTRFLGDLYQDLSEAARKRYALLQTPVFIEQFILDRTLTPAIETFGFREVRMIDPTCGSGHFLLGGFARLFAQWNEALPGEGPSVIAQHALDQVFGVDLNPNVVAIARFRLLLAALRVSGVTRLRDAYDFKIHVTAGDSLLHGRRFRSREGHTTGPQTTFDTEDIFRDELKHNYEVEDVEALHRILGQQYHAVVGNPPYITVKDRAVSELYRARFPSCGGKYSLSVPFMERFFDLAVKGDGTPQQPAGYVGQITANSFMKREFGKKLIEKYLPRWDLTHVLDTSGAYIPGHGTPTVILFGKNQPPVSGTIRTALGIAGEPATPDEPSLGLVWQAIVRQIDEPGSVSEWMSAGDSPRANFHRHPWSIGGGGAAELKTAIDEAGEKTVWDFVEIKRKKPNIGFASFTGLDEAFLSDRNSLLRARIEANFCRDLIKGDIVRDWTVAAEDAALVPCDENFSIVPLAANSAWGRYLWPNRTALRNVESFETTREEEGSAWWGWYRWIPEKYRRPLSITYGEVATHNHFVFDSGGKVFKQTAPVMKLKPGTTENAHVHLLGVLNSSTGCFYLKQICHNKGSTVDAHGARQRTAAFEDFYAFNGTKIAGIPIPAHLPQQLPTALVQTSTALQDQSPAAVLNDECRMTNDEGASGSSFGTRHSSLREALARARDLATRQRRQLIAWQEELDWQIYEAFGLVEAAAPLSPAAVSLPEGAAVDAIPPEGLELGQRAFEIVLARKLAAGEAQSTWFERHGSTPITEVPRHWSAGYRALVERRIARIAGDPAIRLIEQPEYKRRWNTEPWDEAFARAARDWLLLRLETYFFGSERMTAKANDECKMTNDEEAAADPVRHSSFDIRHFRVAERPAITTTNQLAEIAKTDRAFQDVAEQLMDGPGFSVPKLVRELVESASVPFLPALRYKPSGLLKRRDWEHVWDLQRQEDRMTNDEGRMSKPEEAAADAGGRHSVIPSLDIPVPPKYTSGDFKKSVWWSLRGKLDVPKERWVLYAGTERPEDPSPVIAWAGWDHAQQARALAEYYVDARDSWTATADKPAKLRLILAGLLDLQPWLDQWHGANDPLIGDSPANAIRAFLDAEMHALGVTHEDLERLRMGER